MNLSKREHWLLALAAPVLVLSVWAVWLAPALEKRASTAEKRIRDARGAADIKPASGASTARIPDLEHEIEVATQEKSDLDRRVAALRARWSQPLARPTTTRELSELFARHGATIESAGAAASDTALPALAPVLGQLQKRMAEIGGGEPELWRVELRGGFAQLLGAFGELGQLHGFALPLACTLAPHKAGHELAATLWFWI